MGLKYLQRLLQYIDFLLTIFYVRSLNEIIKIDDKLFNIEKLITNCKRGSVKFKENKIIIQIPIGISSGENFKMYLNLKSRVIKYLQKHKEIFEEGEKSVLKFNNGQEFDILNNHFVISIADADTKHSSAKLDGEIIKIRVSKHLANLTKEKTIANLARRIISYKIMPHIISKVNEVNNIFFKSQINEIKLKDNISNWGSCSKNNNINLDFRLVFAPDNVINAVIIHELAHTKQRNHSKDFWNLVYNAMPDYKDTRKWLEQNKQNLLPGQKFNYNQ